MHKFIIHIIALLCCFDSAIAQKSFTISGVVSDQKETLPGAAVYLAGYKIATVTNNDGKFVLPNLQPGTYDVLVQMVGYLPVSKNVVISSQSVDIKVVLRENTTMLNEVVIKPDPNRPYYVNLFKDYFIGRSPHAAQCKILNTNALIFNDDKASRVLTINANDFLIIENLALGYRIKYLLELFEYDYNTKIIFYAGHPTFEEIKGTNSKQKRWIKNREIAYNGSNEHFFKALYAHKLADEGFVLYKRIEVANTKRLPDSLINAKIRQLSTGPNGVTNLITFNGGNDSLSYWMKQKREPKTFNILNRAPILVDTLVKDHDGVLKRLNFKDELYVVNQREKETAAYEFSGHKQARPADLGNAQISVVKIWDAEIMIYPNGAVANPRSALYSGFWSYEKMADAMPMDYVPPAKK